MQKYHPEQRDDEIYMGNQSADGVNRMLWQTRRLGNIAYAKNGEPLRNLHPVFVARLEIENKIAASGDEEQKRIWRAMLDIGAADFSLILKGGEPAQEQTV